MKANQLRGILIVGGIGIGAVTAISAPAGVVGPNVPVTPGFVQPLAEEMPLSERLDQLQRIIDHEDHSIDILSGEEPDRHGYRRQARENAVKARDAVQRLMDDLQHHDSERDVEAAHRRDREFKGERPEYYAGLLKVREYFDHDHDTLSKHPQDREHRRHNAMQFIEDGRAAVQREIDDYLRSHPGAHP